MKRAAYCFWMLASLASAETLIAVHAAQAESAGVGQAAPVASPAKEQGRPEAILYPASRRLRNPDNGHEYQRIDMPLPWRTAKRVCEEVGGHLATVTSAAENGFICRTFATTHVCWLGATDEVEEGKWRWVTGEPFSYTKWFAGEPSNSGGLEHYLAMGSTESIFVKGQWSFYRFGENWNDHAESGTYRGVAMAYAVCEWESAPPSEVDRLRAMPDGGVEELRRFLDDLRAVRPDTSPQSNRFSWPAPQGMQEAAEKILNQATDPLSPAAQLAFRVLLEDKIGTLDRSPLPRQRETVEYVRTFLRAKLEPKSLELQDVQLAWWAARALENAGQLGLAREAHESFAALAAQGDPAVFAEAVKAMQAAALRLANTGPPETP
ncbi:MAG: hypothetical protein MUF25_16780 [Pirellulaceae bacterium]|nr:hypothetical protein [Pirellulaceae bacterium]